jgi:hypothetical protein
MASGVGLRSHSRIALTVAVEISIPLWDTELGDAVALTLFSPAHVALLVSALADLDPSGTGAVNVFVGSANWVAVT